MAETAKKLGVEVDKVWAEETDSMRFWRKCEGQLIQPTFITDYPVEMSPLAKNIEIKKVWQSV